MRTTPLLVVAVLATVLASTAGRDAARAAFPGANGLLCFEANRDPSREVYAMSPDGSAQTNLTDNGIEDDDARWSPDGTKIVFARETATDDDIFVMDADGGNALQLTNDPAADEDPSWSPDGTKIVFSSNRDGNDEIYIMNADGTAETNLTNHPADDDEPHFSPDGTKIAFDTNRDGNDEIYVMDTDGGSPTNLTNHPADDSDVNWSPDGTRLVFNSNRDTNDEIYVMDADGGNQTFLTDHEAEDDQPVFSPDGTLIAFQSDRDGDAEIFVMPATGGTPTQLTFNDTNDEEPDWQPLLGAPSTTTTTTLPSGCTSVPTFESLNCRLAEVLALVNASPDLGALQGPLAKRVAQAKARKDKAEGRCQDGRTPPAKRLVGKAAGKAKGVVRKLGSRKGRQVPDPLRSDLVAAMTAIQTDLKALKSALACPAG